jgi:hypothetical protein
MRRLCCLKLAQQSLFDIDNTQEGDYLSLQVFLILHTIEYRFREKATWATSASRVSSLLNHSSRNLFAAAVLFFEGD